MSDGNGSKSGFMDVVSDALDPTTPSGYKEVSLSPALQLKFQDQLDAFFQVRIFNVRSVLRDLGWDGERHQTLSKDGADAVFAFDHVGAGRNIVGMTINGIRDDLTTEPTQLAHDANWRAQGYAEENRRIDISVHSEDGCDGRFTAVLGRLDDADQVQVGSLVWSPRKPDAQTKAVTVRSVAYGRLKAKYVIDGDHWRGLEDHSLDNDLWHDILKGIPLVKAIEASRGKVALAEGNLVSGSNGLRRNEIPEQGTSEYGDLVRQSIAERNASGDYYLLERQAGEQLGADSSFGMWAGDGELTGLVIAESKHSFVLQMADKKAVALHKLSFRLLPDVGQSVVIDAAEPGRGRSMRIATGNEQQELMQVLQGPEQALNIAKQKAEGMFFLEAGAADIGDGKSYLGEIVAATPAHIIQDIGRGSAALHERSNISTRVRIGERLAITYSKGEGVVKSKEANRSGQSR